MLRLLVVAATGGLGAAVVREALTQNHSVSVLVRSADKLRDTFGDDASRLTAVHVGSATDETLIAAAVKGVSAVISCAPPDPTIASALAKATKSEGVRLVWTAGACTRVFRHRLKCTHGLTTLRCVQARQTSLRPTA